MKELNLLGHRKEKKEDWIKLNIKNDQYKFSHNYVERYDYIVITGKNNPPNIK